MVHLSEIFSVEDLEREIEEGWVRTNTHPRESLYILNYTEKTQYARHWNPVTLACRGLIIDQYYNVIARPWGKFFNWGEPQAAAIPLDNLEITNKMDGSLGILYTYNKLPFIATRGSFQSDQALHATAKWVTRYSHIPLAITHDYTFLFEIIYPENRIVLDYKGQDDLVLLGAVHKASGKYIGPTEAKGLLQWNGPVTQTFTFDDFASAVDLQRPNAEGVVVRYQNSMVKVKQEDYIALHRIVTNLNERTVWEHLKQRKTIRALCDSLPDEFHDWATEVAIHLRAQMDRKYLEVVGEFESLKANLAERNPNYFRKDFALEAKGSPNRAYLFALFDGREIWDMVWEAVKPQAKQ